MTESLDLLIIGAGPAGLSAAETAAREGLRYLVLEKGTIADTIRQYPVGRTLFSTPNELEMFEGALKPCQEKPTRDAITGTSQAIASSAARPKDSCSEGRSKTSAAER